MSALSLTVDGSDYQLTRFAPSTLDLSYNLIKHVPEELEKHLTSLRTIFFVQNKISHIQNLSGFAATLRSLELGGNRIRVSVSESLSLRSIHRVPLSEN